jgi:hypothetical protein
MWFRGAALARAHANECQMQIAISCVITEETAGRAVVARTVESLGFEGLFIPERPVVPHYGRREVLNGRHRLVLSKRSRCRTAPAADVSGINWVVRPRQARALTAPPNLALLGHFGSGSINFFWRSSSKAPAPCTKPARRHLPNEPSIVSTPSPLPASMAQLSAAAQANGRLSRGVACDYFGGVLSRLLLSSPAGLNCVSSTKAPWLVRQSK